MDRVVQPDSIISIRGITKAYHMWSTPPARLVAPLLKRLSDAPFAPPSLAANWRRKAAAAARPFFALRDLSLDVHSNETIGIIGRNGSGKSTLLQIIAGTLAPTAGSVQVRGRIAALLELGAGFNPDFTGRENVFLNAAILGLTPAQTESRFEAIATFADIGDFIEQPVKTFSSGMYVRLAFAVAINVDADVLIIDEALAVGDEAFQRKCYARLRSFKERGGTILFVSHSAASVVELCDRAILLDQGELIASGSPKAVVAKYHKLIYAPASESQTLRDQLRAEAGARPVPRPAPVTASATEAEEDGEFYDPHLVPQSTMAYAALGAEIQHATITTISGEEVNVLRRRVEYVYRYRVLFFEDCRHVRFGMMTKPVTGLELGGAVSAPASDAFELIEAGTEARVRFRFRCLLAPGTYFFNAGVVGAIAEGERYLHRIVDVAMFRVQADVGDLITGLADLEIQPEVILSTPSADTDLSDSGADLSARAVGATGEESR